VILFASGCRFGLIGRYGAEIDHLLNDGMIFGQLPGLTSTDEVRATIADVRDLGAARMDQHRHARRSGPARLRSRSAHL